MFFYYYRHHRDLHSFPTRRSSDLRTADSRCSSCSTARPPPSRISARASSRAASAAFAKAPSGRSPFSSPWRRRSEEHTSELQSRRDLVCRLLLEKKKRKKLLFSSR